MKHAGDTIAAIATPPGRGGVGIVRVSGPAAAAVADRLLGSCPPPRLARYGRFYRDKTNDPQLIDFGIALFFPGPHSFTGEDVLELQGHGGPVVMDHLLAAVLAAGARLARPGEFSERAYLNDKLDLAQAEAIADLIDASTEAAARSALRSLQGDFSRDIHALVEAVTRLRIYLEAALDFPDEEIDFLNDGYLDNALQQLGTELEALLVRAHNGRLLREGAQVVIAGRPNAGKSSLLNRLTGQDSAIVTPIAGTTRDVLREHINLDGIPLHLVDTAGLRDSPDAVEAEGIRRAEQAIREADLVLLVADGSETDCRDAHQYWQQLSANAEAPGSLLLVLNKADLGQQAVGELHPNCLAVSALTGAGIDNLKERLKSLLGFTAGSGDTILARRRHLDALGRAKQLLQHGHAQLQASHSGELLAEDLRQMQVALGEITGQVSADELLGHIFNSFCIGK